VQMKKIQSVLAKHEQSLAAIPGVTSVGIGGSPDHPILLVTVERLTDGLRQALPDNLDGFPVTIEVSGAVTAQPAKPRP